MSNEFELKGVKLAKLPSDYGSTGFKMFKGSILNNVEIAYETWGELSINNDNAITFVYRLISIVTCSFI
jgi:homoserine acetyltransferase